MDECGLTGIWGHSLSTAPYGAPFFSAEVRLLAVIAQPAASFTRVTYRNSADWRRIKQDGLASTTPMTLNRDVQIPNVYQTSALTSSRRICHLA